MSGSGLHIALFGAGDLYNIGGIQLSYSWLLDYLCGRGHRVTFFSHRGESEGQLPYYRFPPDVKIVQYSLVDTRECRERILELTTQADPDVVLVVNSTRNALIIVAALRSSPYPVILSERGSADYCLEQLWTTRRQRHLAHMAADFSHMLMPSYAEALPKFMRGQLHIIPSATQRATQLARPDIPGPDGRFSVIYAGRLSAEKELHLLVRAFEIISAHFPDWNLKIYGEGPRRRLLAKQIAASGIEGRISLMGNTASIEEMYGIYARSHAFALPSRAEGCPLALREAMAHGLPVVGFTDCSGTNEIIQHEQNGLLASSNDKVASMAAALRSLFADPALRLRLGQQATKDVKRYDPIVIHQAWERLLKRAATYNGSKKRLLRLARAACHPIQRLEGYLQLRRLAGMEAVRMVLLHDRMLGDWIRIVTTCLDAYYELAGSSLFDPHYYLKSNFHIKKQGLDPLYHYLTVGWREGLRPSAEFDPDRYVREHMGGTLTECPLVHLLGTSPYRSQFEQETLAR